MTCGLQSTFEDSGIEWPVLKNNSQFLAHFIQLALGAFLSSLGVKSRTKSWEAHECDQQFGENESKDNGKSQTLRKEGNTRNNKVSAMRLGLAKIIEKVRTSTYFESPETALHDAENACCIDYTNTWLSQQVHWLSNSRCPHHSTTDYGCEDTLKLDPRVAWPTLPIIRTHWPVSAKSKIQ